VQLTLGDLPFLFTLFFSPVLRHVLILVMALHRAWLICSALQYFLYVHVLLTTQIASCDQNSL